MPARLRRGRAESVPERHAAQGAHSGAPAARRRMVRGALALSMLTVAATACSKQDQRLGLPAPATEQAKRVLTLWQGSWIAALLVGGLVWGLIIWAIIFHRKRSEELPPQVRYNLPIEMLYTVVPFVIVAVLFYFTARDETYLDKFSKHAQVNVTVTAFQWSWQFDYPQYPGFSIVGVPVNADDNNGKPVLVIPQGETVRFHLVSKDVIHSFWVPSFIFKRDILPGVKTGEDFEITPTRLGTYQGRCAELCGVDHSRMLFEVKIVTPSEFQQFIASHQAAGRTQ